MADLSQDEIDALDRRDRNDITYLKRGMTELKRIVKGYNGSTGLAGHAEKTDLALIDLKKGQEDIKKLLVGDETDANDDGGMRGKQRDIEKVQTASKRLAWIAIGAIVTGMVSVGFAFFVHLASGG